MEPQKQKTRIPLMSQTDIRLMLEKLEEDYPTVLLPKIDFSFGERVCGSISNNINDYLHSKGIVFSKFVNGTYKGRGTEFSGGKEGTGHCWVEIICKTTRPFDSRLKKTRIIIDGAYAQFFPKEFSTTKMKDRVRLMIFVDDHIANRWYRKYPRRYTR